MLKIDTDKGTYYSVSLNAWTAFRRYLGDIAEEIRIVPAPDVALEEIYRGVFK